MGKKELNMIEQTKKVIVRLMFAYIAEDYAVHVHTKT